MNRRMWNVGVVAVAFVAFLAGGCRGGSGDNEISTHRDRSPSPAYGTVDGKPQAWFDSNQDPWEALRDGRRAVIQGQTSEALAKRNEAAAQGLTGQVAAGAYRTADGDVVPLGMAPAGQQVVVTAPTQVVQQYTTYYVQQPDGTVLAVRQPVQSMPTQTTMIVQGGAAGPSDWSAYNGNLTDSRNALAGDEFAKVAVDGAKWDLTQNKVLGIFGFAHEALGVADHAAGSVGTWRNPSFQVIEGQYGPTWLHRASWPRRGD